MGERCPGPLGLDGDLDDDALVTRNDLRIVWLCLETDPATQPGCAAADVDRDGDVDVFDLAQVDFQLGLRVCNGSPLLCERGYDAVAYPTTHNAFASQAEGFAGLANQSVGLPEQLADGVRALMLDTHYGGLPNRVLLCHGVGYCFAAAKDFAEGLTEIRDFLEAHPGEVVTLIFESYVSAADTAAVFEAVGLWNPEHPGSDLLYEQPGGSWPTLGELVATNQRLVVFQDRSVAEQLAFPWYHYLWDELVFETDFDAQDPEDFSCTDLRGEPGNDLFILNHFLTRSVGTPLLADMVNHDPFFLERAFACQAFQGRIPNFVTVDYYRIGDLFHVVDALNGLPVR